MKYQIITDSIADLPEFWLEQHPEVSVVEMPVVAIKPGHQEVEFRGLNADTFAEADAYVKKGYTTKTSMPVIYESEGEAEAGVLSVERLTKQFLAQGKDVMYLALNSAISGVYHNVSMLYNRLYQQYPDQLIYAVDTECASTGLAMLIMDLVEAKIDDTLTARIFVKENQSRIAHVFTWFDFTYIQKSGKVRALEAIVGRMLGFHPLGSVEYTVEGRPLLALPRKIRGTYKFVDKFAHFVEATIENSRGRIIVAHGNCADKAAMIAEAIREYLPEAEILCGDDWRCGAAIQAHGGPTSIHVNYYRKPAVFEETVEIFSRL